MNREQEIERLQRAVVRAERRVIAAASAKRNDIVVNYSPTCNCKSCASRRKWEDRIDTSVQELREARLALRRAKRRKA